MKIFKGKLDKSSSQNFSKDIYTIAKVIHSAKQFVQTAYKIEGDNGVLKNNYVANDLFLVKKVKKSPASKEKEEATKKQATSSKTSKPQAVTPSERPKRAVAKVDYKKLNTKGVTEI